MDVRYSPPQPDATWPLAQVLALAPTEAATWGGVRRDFEVNHPDVMTGLRIDIAERGLITPLLIDPTAGTVVNGHHRVLVCDDLAIACVPVIFTDGGAAPEAFTWDPYDRQRKLYDCDECGVAGCTAVHDD